MTESTPKTHAGPLLWSPTEEAVASSILARFVEAMQERYGIDLPDYEALHRWSIENLNEFWLGVWEFFDPVASVQPTVAIDEVIMPGADWFPGVKLNFAENILRHAAETPDKTAIIGEHEVGEPTVLTWRELAGQVAALAAHLKSVGVGPGDRVVGVLPNIPETVVALLATASLGAIWSVVGTDFGVQGVADRFAQLDAKVLFTVDGYHFNGEHRSMLGTIDELREVLPTVEHVIVIDQSAGTAEAGDIPEEAARYSQIVATNQPAELEFAQLDFSHPLWVLYSSGTTGQPKGIVQSHGGITLEFFKALSLQSSQSADDIAYFNVATTWMVWNLHIGNLLLGTTIITYDGSLTAQGPSTSFAILAKYGATFFGTGAAVLPMVQKTGIVPKDEYDLSALRSIFVTGSPLPDATWDWIYEAVGSDLRLSSDSGGTDVCSGLVGGNPFASVYRGEIAGPYLGLGVESWNDAGKRIVGEVGELVITTPGPSMPIYFWNDEDGAKLHDAYFDHFPGVWRHGDLITELPSGGFVIHGRSDATLNRGGIRMGSSDVTNVVEEIDGVAASMVIGAELSGGEYYMPLFVVPKPEVDFDKLSEEITSHIRTQLSPRYVPDEIIAAPGLPRTRTGKLLEVPLKKLYQGASPTTLNRETVDDTELLDWFADHAVAFAEGRGSPKS